jgi:hypothetical protein
VTVDIVMTEGQRKVMDNLSRKNVQAQKMFGNLVKEMNNGINSQVNRNYTKELEVPSWL